MSFLKIFCTIFPFFVVILIFIEINGGAKKHGICGMALENASKM